MFVKQSHIKHLPFSRLLSSSQSVTTESDPSMTFGEKEHSSCNRYGLVEPSPTYNYKYKSRSGQNLAKGRLFMMATKFSIKSVGVALFVGACLFCLYKIWALTRLKPIKSAQLQHELKMVNIFFRHGDRSPSDSLPEGDPHAPLVEHLWPNGLGELTDLGRFRQYRLGLDTRRQYNDYLGYNSSKLAAYSSPLSRCVESMQYTLRGLFDNQWPKDRQRSILTQGRPTSCSKHHQKSAGQELSCAINLPEGSGFGDEWKRVEVDKETIPMLTYDFLNQCKFRIDNPSPIDKNLTHSPAIRSLIGIERLRKLLLEHYGQELNFYSLGLWSTLSSELNLVLTRSNAELERSFITDLIGQVVSTRSKSLLTLYDVYEQAVLLGYRDRLEGDSEYIQSGSLITSVIESQLNALDEKSDSDEWLWPSKTYEGKKMLLYSSHDSILQRMLFSLGIIHMEPAQFEARFAKWYKSKDDLAKFLAGLRMSSYGMSFRIELWQTTLNQESGIKRFPYVKVSMYNQEDPKFQEVEYRPVEIGTACMRLFRDKYGVEALDELSRFYDPELVAPSDKRRICPFDLFLNVTSELRVSKRRLQLELCPSGEQNHNASSHQVETTTNQLPDLVDGRK